MTTNLTDSANHPANSPLTGERIERVIEALQRSIQYQNGGDMAYVIADAIKGLEELQVSKESASNPVGDDELDHLIWGLQREGFHARTLAALVELRERRKSDAECRSADSLHDQLSRLATHSAEESAQMEEWDRLANKSELLHRAERLATDARELADRLSSPDGEPE
ncbi:TPA: hypothetical protein K8M71_004450 [Citrobacter freundii]|nr:hypothetical protein [Citrobacter freundii]